MASPKLTAKLALDNSDFKKGLKESEQSLFGFKGNILGLATGLSILGGAFALVTGYLKSTDTGARILTSSLRIAKQALVDMITTQKVNFGNLAAMREVAKKENDIREGNRIDLVKEAELQTRVAELRFKAADQTKTDAERLAILNDVLKAHNALIDYKVQDTKEELLNIQEQIVLGGRVSTLLDEEAKKKAELISLDGERVGEMRRVESVRTGLMAAETERLKDMAKAQAEMLARLKEANTAMYMPGFRGEQFAGIGQSIKFGGMARGGADLAGAPKEIEPVNQMTQALELQNEAVNILTNSFAALFASEGQGFKNMIDTMIAGMRRLVAEYLAKALVFALIRALFPATNIAIMATKGLWNMGLGGRATSNLGGFQSQPMNVNVVGSIKGKDIGLSLRRNGF